MAALMQRVLRTSSITLEKSRISLKEYASLHDLKSRFLSTSAGDGLSPAATSPKSEKGLEGVPNQTNYTFSAVDRNEQANSRTRKIKNLLDAACVGDEKQSFAKLFRDSNFAHLGDPRGKVVLGTIFKIVGDDVYIDFGWKFPCVVRRPTQDAKLYVNGAVVRLRILNLEMSTIFLGAEKETSLNEANCYLLGLESSPLGVPQQQLSKAA